MQPLRRFLVALPIAISMSSIILMIGVTLADVLGRNLFGLSFKGTYEIVQIALCIAIFAGLPAVSRQDSHIVIDVIDTVLPAWGVRLAQRAASFLLAALAALLIHSGWEQSRTVFLYGELTGDLGLSKLVFWVPILVGLAGAGLAALLNTCAWTRANTSMLGETR